MWKISKTPSTQTVGGSLPLLIYAVWGAKAECQIINRTGFSCAFLPDSIAFHWCHRFTSERVWSVWVCVIDLMGPPVILTSWNTESCISGFHSSCLPCNICYSADAGKEVPGVVGTAGKSVFGSFLPKSWPNVCRTSTYGRRLLATALEQRFITDCLSFRKIFV